MANASFYMKDDRKRISELNQNGYTIIGKICDGRCTVRHSANIFMRKMIQRPLIKPTHWIKGVGHLPSYEELEARGLFS